MIKVLSKASAFGVAIALGASPVSAIVITETQDALSLANALLVPDSSITINSASLIGGAFGNEFCDGNDCEVLIPSSIDVINAASTIPSQPALGQAGIFSNASGTYNLPAAGGIVFSTGNVTDAQDSESTQNFISGGNGNSATSIQNELLEPLTGISAHFDPVQLDISFTVDGDQASTITFFGAFGSEEFPDFVGDTFIDGFGLYVNGENVAGALTSDAEIGDSLAPININHPDFVEMPGTALNGVLAPNGNPLLRFDVPVLPGDNTFTLLLADAGDSSHDSVMYLASFGELGESEFTPILPDLSNPTNDDGEFVFELPEVEAEETIWFDPDVASGYVYTSNLAIASVTAPSLATVPDPDGYILEFTSGNTLQQFTLDAGETFDFGLNGFDDVFDFSILGINLDLALDPTNPQAFVTGVSFAESGDLSFTQAPIITFVPDDPVNSVPAPSSVFMWGISLLGLLITKRKLKK
ncbi:choice-of-anchor L domain-containing protein [Alteromonas sp. PRIM-21]|uniref:choice-of-anchor L domain-containing protein n=1 Tax=Alteromonas sp. PRIM-21 TaxID=1454978 RepID=UPI0022B96E0F|nr:choice-of-anchor L domain-containing protein [Alteromonas sp. PRIM-21]MCZ8530468.1 choice-of-anchor L domain-containing protein [Alteromonas sp. PRIM-21]